MNKAVIAFHVIEKSHIVVKKEKDRSEDKVII